MINTYDIITAFTRSIKTAIKGTRLDTAIFIDKEKLQAFDNDKKACFFIEKHDVTTEVGSYETNYMTAIMDISYFPQRNTDIRAIYEIADLLLKLFARNIRVKEEVIDIVDSTSEVINDEVGNFLHIAFTLEYFDLIVDFKDYELMQDVDVEKGE